MPRRPIGEVHEFMRMYHLNLESYNNAEHAYHATEREWYRRYKEYRYKDYQSFRSAKSFYMSNHF